MPYIQPLDRAAATGATAATLDAIQKKLGALPNLFRTLARSPAALQAYVQLAAAAGGGRFDAARRERIAVQARDLVAQTDAKIAPSPAPRE